MEDKINSILLEAIPEYEDYTGNDLVKDGLIDSMTLLEIIAEIEEEYGIEIPQESMKSEKFKNVETIITLIKDLM